MADDVYVSIVDGAAEAIGGGFCVLFQGDVRATDDEIEFGQDGVFEIHSAVDQDVDLAAGEQLDLFGVFFADFADIFGVFKEAIGGEAVGNHLAFGVIGDSQELISLGDGGFG